MVRFLKSSAESLAEAARLLEAGEVVAVPTETVYGLAADATRDAPLRRIYAAKDRPADNPLIVHVGEGFSEVERLIEAGYVEGGVMTPRQRRAADRLIRAFWPGPLTLILPRGPRLSDTASAGRSTIGLRMPAHPVLRDLLNQLSFPLAAPSANLSNRISPTTAEAVREELGERIPLILDGGPCTVGVESTIVQVGEGGDLVLLRPGGVSFSALEAAVSGSLSFPEKKRDRTLAPGQRDVHYSPHTPVILCSPEDGKRLDLELQSVESGEPLAVLLLTRTELPSAWVKSLQPYSLQTVALGDEGDGARAARELFQALRELDRGPAVRILVETPPLRTDGLWPALRDRLIRAARLKGA